MGAIDSRQNAGDTSATVTLSTSDYGALISARDENEELRKRLRQISYLIAEVLEGKVSELPASGDEEDSNSVTAAPSSEAAPQTAADLDVRYYQRARGYYGRGGFVVLKGSRVRTFTSASFKGHTKYAMSRQRLIDGGDLVPSGDGSDFGYVLGRNIWFRSSSAAACIVDGNSRSGPEAWGVPRSDTNS